MRLCRNCLLLAALILLVTAATAMAARTSFRYDAAQRVVNACVLGIDPQTPDTHPNPYVIEGIRRSPLCPDDWVFENPLAGPTVVTGQTPDQFTVKGKRDYWFVPLTEENARRLRDMDLIYISAPDLDLTPAQMNGLVTAVEAGAILWVDEDVTAGRTAVTTFPWQFEFDNMGAGTHARVALDSRHGLLTEPYRLGVSGVSRLGEDPDWGATGVSGLYITNVEPAFRTVVQVGDVAGDGTVGNRQPFIVAASWGSGSIVVSTGGVGLDVSEWIVEFGESGFTQGRRPSPDPAQAPDVQLALNMIQWNDRWEQARGTPRAPAATVARAPFPLDIGWQYPAEEEDPAVHSIGAVVSTPVYSRGMVYAISLPSMAPPTAARLMCFDTEPEQSLDGDAFPDDGVGDYGQGAPYDMIWEWVLPDGHTPRYAGPALASMNVTGTTGYEVPVQVVLISTVDTSTVPHVGYVSCINATYDPEVLSRVPAPFDTPGGLVWTRAITGYDDGVGPAGSVAALSTPVVHNGFVYVLATEHDPTLGAPNPEDNTYGRAHCFELAFDWSGGSPDDGAKWVYPSDATNIDGIGTDMQDPNTGAPVREPQRALPAFHDPRWVALPAAARPPLPPSPGSIPVVHSAGESADGRPADALLTFGTAATHRYRKATKQIRIDNSAGGSQFCLVPAPQRLSTGEIALNAEYYLVRTNAAMPAAADYIDTAVVVDGLAPASWPLVDEDAWFDTRHVVYAPAAVREAVVESGSDPIEAQLGVPVEVEYTAATEQYMLPGPVRWRRELPRGQRATQPSAMSPDEVVVSAGEPVDYLDLPAPGTGEVTALEGESGAVKWSYDPLASTPDPGPNPGTLSVTGAAMDADTAVVAGTRVDAIGAPTLTRGAVVGLSRQVEASVRLGPVDPADPAQDVLYHVSPDSSNFVVQVLGTGNVISPRYYRVNRMTRELVFPAETAGRVRAQGIPGRFPIYGRAIRVTWSHDNQTPEDPSDDQDPPSRELHRVPPIERFHHTPGYIRLRHWPVDWTAGSEPTITRPDGTPIVNFTPLGPTVAAFGRDLRPDGWVDMTAAQDAYGDPVQPGDELLVSYTTWSERDARFINIPNPPRNIPRERHQMAPLFGPSLSSPAVAGNTIHVGTQGLDDNLDGAFDPPLPGPPPRSIDRTLLSLMWNRATGFVQSGLARPARRHPTVAGIPVVSSSPSVTEDRVFVGSRIMGTADATDVDLGYVSALVPWQVLLCDSNRIVETTGDEPSWVCTGTASPQRAQSFIGEDLKRPFSRPAKATRLQSGNILVVDTGNNRVVEIDRAGRVVWPLDEFGYEYYTSPDNHDLRLSRPADAWRYYDLETVDLGGGNVREFPVLHTVIADTGNARVVDVITRFHNPATNEMDGRQRHEVRTVTPTYVRVGQAPRKFLRVRYTSAQPIFDPGNDQLIGYLCAASNLNQVIIVAAGSGIVNPGASVETPGGSGATWKYWAWLYDPDPEDGDNVSNEPLRFENVKHVEYRRYGSTLYLTVTCTRYAGRTYVDGVQQPPHPLAEAGPGVYEFRIDISDPDPANWALDEMGAGAPWPTDQPHWYFVQRYETPAGSVREDYAGKPMTLITTAQGTAQERTYDKRWYPVCAHRLRSGSHLIVNSLSQIESATPGNIGSGARNAVLGSHIFEVSTRLNVPEDPDDDAHRLDDERSVPAPGEMWKDPFTQPAYAEVR
ncbi:MAG: hypothetical protein U9R79_14885 [Armatimonadota bacterium]|nr:hypothetical protein [Armatimonadota bacterium]